MRTSHSLSLSLSLSIYLINAILVIVSLNVFCFICKSVNCVKYVEQNTGVTW